MAEDAAPPAAFLERVFMVLQYFTERREWSLSDLVKATTLPKSSVYRLVQMLVRLEILRELPDTRGYGLGVRGMGLAQGLVGAQGETALVFPELWDLAQRTGESVNLGVPVTQGMMYIQRIRSAAMLQVDSPPGTVVPYHCTAMGKAYWACAGHPVDALPGPLVAFTPAMVTDPGRLEREFAEIRAHGYAVDRGEHLVGVWRLGAPLRDRSGQVVAAIGMGIPAARVTPERLDQLLEALLTTVGRAQSRFGGGAEGRGRGAGRER